MALVTFPERKVTRAVGRRGKDMDVEQQRHWVPAFAGMTVQTKTGALRRPFEVPVIRIDRAARDHVITLPR